MCGARSGVEGIVRHYVGVEFWWSVGEVMKAVMLSDDLSQCRWSLDFWGISINLSYFAMDWDLFFITLSALLRVLSLIYLHSSAGRFRSLIYPSFSSQVALSQHLESRPPTLFHNEVLHISTRSLHRHRTRCTWMRSCSPRGSSSFRSSCQ